LPRNLLARLYQKILELKDPADTITLKKAIEKHTRPKAFAQHATKYKRFKFNKKNIFCVI
jgi:hypothetical protein